METAIHVDHVSKSFVSPSDNSKTIKALDQVSLAIPSGEILGILGPNGAGKTTFLNILSTLLLADTGKIEILGIPSRPENYSAIRSQINMTSGYPNFPWSLTIEENLRFYGRLYGLRGPSLTRRIADLVAMFNIGDYAQRRFDELSSGTKQRLSLAKCLLNEPKIIFLDEPTVGLDPDVAAKTRQIILDILNTTKVTVLFTTHNMPEAEMMCKRIAFIKEGQILKLATPAELKNSVGKKDLEEVFIELAHAQPNSVDGQKDAVVHVGSVPSRIRPQKATVLATVDYWLRRCLAFTYRNYIFAVRNFFAFAELLFWPIVSLISIGLMGDYLKLQEQALAFILTGAITAGVLQVTQLDVAYSLLYEVWSKSMKHTLLTPVGVSESLFGSWIIGMVRGTVVFGILAVFAIFLFKFKFPALGITLVFLFGIFCCAFLLGLLVNVLILLFGQKAEITAWMFAYLFMLLCGIYYPIETLPPFFHSLAQWIPITYFLEYFRQNFGFASSLGDPLLKGFGLIIVYLAAGLLSMDYAFYQARKKGVIIRLSE